MNRAEWRRPAGVRTAVFASAVVSLWLALLIFVIHRSTS